MTSTSLSLLAMTLIMALLSPLAGAVPLTLGSPLTAAPNLNLGCDLSPFPELSGGYSLIPSNTADCTWSQSGVFGVISGDSRFRSVPADGWITSVSVRSGPNPAPLNFVIFRQLAAPGGYGDPCCFFVRETGLLQLQPNTITTFRTFIRVERNLRDGALAYDLFGVSAPAGAGSLPLAQVGPITQSAFTTPGSVNAGYLYPRIGALANDEFGGRRELGIPGIELLVQWTFCPATDGQAFCAALANTGGVPGNGNNGGNGANNGGGGVNNGNGGGVVVAPTTGPTLASPTARVTGKRARLPLNCVGADACIGRLQIFRPNGQRTQNLGSKRFRLAAGQQAVVAVPVNLTGDARKRLRSGMAAGVRIIQGTGTSVQAVTLIR